MLREVQILLAVKLVIGTDFFQRNSMCSYYKKLHTSLIKITSKMILPFYFTSIYHFIVLQKAPILSTNHHAFKRIVSWSLSPTKLSFEM